MAKVSKKRTEKAPFDLQANETCDMKVANYGDALGLNKKNLWRALCRCRLNLSKEEKRLLIAIAMQETDHMDISERDPSKDEDKDAANVSIFNLNMHMLRELGYRGAAGTLNTPRGLAIAVTYAGLAMRTWTAKRFLDYHRGGSTGFKDGKSFDCQGYRNAINTMMPELRKDLSLANSNNFRCEIFVKHQGISVRMKR